MKLKYTGTLFVFTILFSVSFLSSCKDDWNQHFNEVSIVQRSDLNLYDFIKSKENLSTFTTMLENTGYDKILSNSQTFTVWAPDNSSLTGIDPNNKALALEIVKNHIANYSFTTSGVISLTIAMVNGKLLPFTKNSKGYSLDGVNITTADLGTSNGILHILAEYSPYKKNIWEFIDQTSGLDSLKSYINSISFRVLDSVASYDKNGILVDSIFKIKNAVFDQLGKINIEDSIYTALLPNNTAWSELYNRISPYYKMLPADGGANQQRKSTLWTLAKNLFFYGAKNLPLSENKLVSTGNITFHNPTVLFDNTQKNTLSNGLAYVASTKLNVQDTASWNKPIKFEAEWQSYYGTTLSNYTASTLSGLGTNFLVSNKNYLYLKDASLNSISKLYATFPIPYTLSTKYNIYCVFIPRLILDANDVRPYKIKFTINYLNNAGTVTTGYVDINHNVQTSASSLATFTTDATKLDKMLVASNFQIQYSNVILTARNAEEFAKQIKFSLKIENATAKNQTEMAKFSRDLMIDCIILEPVQ